MKENCRKISRAVAVAFFATVCLLFPETLEAQNVRFSYTFWKAKEGGESSKYAVHKDMKLDYCQGKAAFYSEKTFLRDSLRMIAFDGKNIVDDQAYAALTKTRNGLTDMTVIDYKAHAFTAYHRRMYIYVSGNGELPLPSWTIADTTKVFAGYTCVKAEAHFLGRDWIAWFTEDIPLNTGPWLLWGLPGLIVRANDAENQFVFSLTGAEEIEDSHRISGITSFYNQKESGNLHVFPIDKAELFYAKLCVDNDFLAQIMGGAMYIKDSSGQKNTIPFSSHISLIPLDYWQK